MIAASNAAFALGVAARARQSGSRSIGSCPRARFTGLCARSSLRARARSGDFQIVDSCGYVDSADQAFFIGLPQQIFWAIATLPHLTQRKPAITYTRSMIVAIPWPKPMHMVWSP
jgi:hypothetical protein